jgi:nuclear pore complex protein Nup107
MDLSTLVASPPSTQPNGLADAFTASKRMRELVTVSAHTSRMMLVMKASGRPRKNRKDGKELGIWEITPQGAPSVAADLS